MEAEELAKRLAERIIKGQKTLDLLERQILDEVKVSDLTLREWAKELYVEMPDETDDLDALQLALSSAGASIQKAEFLLGLFEMQAASAQNYSDKQFATRFVVEMESNSKKVGAEKIKQLVLANEDIDSSIMTTQSASLVRDFFKRLVRGLEETRKTLEGQVYVNRTRVYLSGRSND